jgi:hypothetical protein
MEVVAVKDIVAEDQRRRILFEKRFADAERLGQPIRRGLHRMGELVDVDDGLALPAEPVQDETRSLSDIDRSTAANDPRPSASFSARKNPQCIPANTPPVFPGLRPHIWPHLLPLVTNGNVG